MKTINPKAGKPRGAPFKTPAKVTSRPVPSEAIVALRLQLKQLTTDLAAIAGGRAGSTFAKGDRARLEKRIGSIGALLAKLDLDGASLGSSTRPAATKNSGADKLAR